MRFILKDVRQWKIRYDVLRFGILLLVVVIVWAGIELYNTYNTTTIPNDYADKIESFNPSLDLEMISEIENREETPENFNVVVVNEDVVEPTVKPKVATGSSELNPSPPASGSGL